MKNHKSRDKKKFHFQGFVPEYLHGSKGTKRPDECIYQQQIFRDSRCFFPCRFFILEIEHKYNHIENCIDCENYDKIWNFYQLSGNILRLPFLIFHMNLFFYLKKIIEIPDFRYFLLIRNVTQQHPFTRGKIFQIILIK